MKRLVVIVALLAMSGSALALPTLPWLVGKKDVVAALPTMPFLWPRWLKDLLQPNPTILNN